MCTSEVVHFVEFHDEDLSTLDTLCVRRSEIFLEVAVQVESSPPIGILVVTFEFWVIHFRRLHVNIVDCEVLPVMLQFHSICKRLVAVHHNRPLE